MRLAVLAVLGLAAVASPAPPLPSAHLGAAPAGLPPALPARHAPLHNPRVTPAPQLGGADAHLP